MTEKQSHGTAYWVVVDGDDGQTAMRMVALAATTW